MSPQYLTDEQLDLVHAGAVPIPHAQRRVYYGHIADALDGRAAISSSQVRDLVQAAQRRVIGPGSI
jgi:hypothetical protein